MFNYFLHNAKQLFKTAFTKVKNLLFFGLLVSIVSVFYLQAFKLKHTSHTKPSYTVNAKQENTNSLIDSTNATITTKNPSVSSANWSLEAIYISATRAKVLRHRKIDRLKQQKKLSSPARITSVKP